MTQKEIMRKFLLLSGLKIKLKKDDDVDYVKLISKYVINSIDDINKMIKDHYKDLVFYAEPHYKITDSKIGVYYELTLGVYNEKDTVTFSDFLHKTNYEEE